MIPHRILAMLLLIGAVAIGEMLPLARGPAVLISLSLATLVARWPALLPAAVVAGVASVDLTTWTGRSFANEFDALLLSSLAGAFWSADRAAEWPRGRLGATLLLLLFTSYSFSMIVGLGAAWRDAADWGNAYDSPLNALRVTRPIFYAAACWYLLSCCPRMRGNASRSLAAGFGVGLVLVVSSVVLERLRFSGLLDTQGGFRVTGPFADMHTGGAYLDAYLVMGLPFLSCLWRWSRWGKLVTVALLPGCLYAAVVTLSRAPIAVLAVSGAVLVSTWPLTSGGGKKLLMRGAFAILWVLLITGAIAVTPAVQARFATAVADLQTRVDHWHESLALNDRGLLSRLFGVGCGGFPNARREQMGQKAPRDYQFRSDSEGDYLRLIPDAPVYLGQRVSLQPHANYTLIVRCRRVSGIGKLAVSMHEKNLLSSFRAVHAKGLSPTEGAGLWVTLQRAINTGDVGAPIIRSYFPAVHRPLWLNLSTSRGTVIDIDQVQLINKEGVDLVANGDFRIGHDRWWWTADDHRAWHALNLYVHLFVEQGWLGLGSFLAASLCGLRVLAVRATHGDCDALAAACSIGSALAIGTIDSLVDSPRIAIQYYLLVGVALLGTPQKPGS